MTRVRYEEVQCQSALNRVEGMGFRWSLNPYRGCVHSCHYCFARRYHGYFDLNASEDFTSMIFVKLNAPQVLRRELARPSWKRETVAVGTATDPYQPAEGKYRLTRGCLEAFVDFRSPIGLVTKGTLIVRDIDVLSDLAGVADCSVCFSVTTLDPQLWRSLEPGTPPPWKRLWAMEQLVKAGITAGVLLAPIIPGLTDSQESLESVVKAAAEHGARFLGANVLYLKPGTKEHFLSFLSVDYPGLLETYQRLYPGSYAPKRFKEMLRSEVAALKSTYGLDERRSPATRLAPAPRQLELALEV